MSRAGSVMLGGRIVVEQSSLVNETHLLTPKSLVHNNSRLVKKILGSRKMFGTIFGVAKRKGLGTAVIAGPHSLEK